MGRPLHERIVAAFLWIGAFSFACGIFLSLTLLFPPFPPTAPVAVGLVTVERYSKLKDYAGAALFFLLVPPLTIWLRSHGQRLLRAQLARIAWRQSPGAEALAGIVFTAPFFLSPLLYLTTGKLGWVLALPVALAFAGTSALTIVESRLWIRRIFRSELGPYHALVFVEGLSWILFRYLTTGRRIAHISTLFLELVFIGLFLAMFWGLALLIVRLAELNFGAGPDETFRKISLAGLPLFALPFLSVAFVPLPHPGLLVIVTLLVCAALAMRRIDCSPPTAWKLAALLLIPALVYLFSYSSVVHLSQWVDLFHRGESLGPASDYLRGKVPYRDVFALHGMLEDGLLDAWLMQLFGRSAEVSAMRGVILASGITVALWYLGLVLFRSIPLALICVAMSSWTTAENNRTVFQVAAVALFWFALSRRNRFAAVVAGIIGGMTLFFSLDIGLYTIAGGLTAALLLAIASRRTPWDGLPPGQAALLFTLGVLLGAAPFSIYLALLGAFDDFLVVSFVSIPRTIDAIWSLPFPDLVSGFRHELNLHTLADFVLWEKFHLIVSPLTIAIAAVYFIQRWLRRRVDRLDYGLLVIAVSATIAQRTAFGRAEIRHQYFAAYLIGPLIVLLAVVAARTLREIWDSAGEGTRAFLATIVVMSIPAFAVLFWVPDLVNARLDEVARYSSRVLRSERDGKAEEVAARIDSVSTEVWKLTRPGEPIFDFSNQPAFYFFVDRPNPTRFYQVPILSPPALQAETIRALARSRPKVVLRKSPEGFDSFDGVTNDLRAAAVSAYLEDNYHFHRSLRGVEIWTPKPGARPAPLATYLRRIRLPEREELVRSGVEKIVFPVVGAATGVGGAYWASDLTLHNPYREPISIRLRYVSGETRIDRRLTLGQRQTIRWSQVTRSFFGAPEGIGTLWLEHRQGRKPVAVIRTSDVAHGARAAVEAPLTAGDGATAGADGELVIVGVPGGAERGRRINIGVVNIGLYPATFEISARTRDGKVIGEPVLSGIAEEDLWLVPDVEQVLGVKVDETMSIRIAVVAGTGVAFATVIEPNGDHEFIAAIPAQQQ